MQIARREARRTAEGRASIMASTGAEAGRVANVVVMAVRSVDMSDPVMVVRWSVAI